ncbi:MAG: hypothetical protein H6566_05800 [Lewinellaceae bacterium]|nr:hypothetical protein [Lewinellaceae bacterium]
MEAQQAFVGIVGERGGEIQQTILQNSVLTKCRQFMTFREPSQAKGALIFIIGKVAYFLLFVLLKHSP